MEEKKQIAFEKLKESKGFISICDDGNNTHFITEGFSINEALGLAERYKHKLIAEYDKSIRDENQPTPQKQSLNN